MKCPQCQNELSAASRFCTHCGAAQMANVAATPAASTQPHGRANQVQNVMMLILLVLMGVVVAQNITLTRSMRNLLDNVTIAAAPENMNMPHATHGAAESPNSSMVFAALRTPCGKCNKLLAENDCDHANGAQETKNLIHQMFAEGKSIHQVISYFVERYGEQILSPQALAIFKQKRAAGR